MPTPSFGQQLFVLGAWITGAFVAVKVVQAVLDEEYEGRLLPRGVRRRLVDEHVVEHGHVCHGWGRPSHRVRWGDLSVDHIIAAANGGRTSVYNSGVLCRSCNSSKGKRNTMLDFLVGR
jgi:hypothetical protein